MQRSCRAFDHFNCNGSRDRTHEHASQPPHCLKDIQTWLGHSNYNFTADTYLHTAPTAHLQMANTYSEKLEELLPPQIISQDVVLEKC